MALRLVDVQRSRSLKLSFPILDSAPHPWHLSFMAKKTEPTKARTAAKDSGERRGTTIYWNVDLLKRAKKYGIDEDRELSEIVTTAVTEYLDRIGASAFTVAMCPGNVM